MGARKPTKVTKTTKGGESSQKKRTPKRAPVPILPVSDGESSDGGNQEAQSQNRDGSSSSLKELESNLVQHILVVQNKKIPVKKSELVKSLSGQTKDYRRIIRGTGDALSGIFGFDLVGIRQGEGEWVTSPLETATHFIVASQFDLDVKDLGPNEELDKINRPTIIKNAAIRVILNCLYIINRDVDEEYIWKILQESDLTEVCEKQENLRKFLKTDMVDTLYIARTEVKNTEDLSYRYNWGIRAESECDKYKMLKHIAETLGKPMTSFKKQYSELMASEKYKEIIERESQRSQDTEGGNGDNQGENTQDDLQEILETQDRTTSVAPTSENTPVAESQRNRRNKRNQ